MAIEGNKTKRESKIQKIDFNPQTRPRSLILVLGDQLNSDSEVFKDFDPACDAVWMAEVAEESTHVWSHKTRIVLFLSAMRHFRDDLRRRGITVHYRELDDKDNKGNLNAELTASVRKLRPSRLIVVQPGEWRVAQNLGGAARGLGIELELRDDPHFMCSRAEFAAHAKGRKQMRMEFFYREMRERSGVLMKDGLPLGGSWNYDIENRKSFGREGPGLISHPLCFPPDATTAAVIELVQKVFPLHPGNLQKFDWPVTSAEALLTLEDFIANRLPLFGAFEDAMWTGQTFLYHSRLSSSMNLKLINPRVVLAAAEAALEKKHAPLAAVEGFVRQILGWREFVHGVYWHFMPEYIELNALAADAPLPSFYWTGETDMNCLKNVLGQTLEYGFAHHIQRLMVAGLFTLLLGVKPQEVHKWYLAVYVDAVEWVELPNTLGMSQYGDGGIMGSKPYIASGKYIQRMSNYCEGCRFDPAKRTGPGACPFTTLYWDFLIRHNERFLKNPRMVMQLKNVVRLTEEERELVRRQAAQLKLVYGK